MKPQVEVGAEGLVKVLVSAWVLSVKSAGLAEGWGMRRKRGLQIRKLSCAVNPLQPHIPGYPSGEGIPTLLLDTRPFSLTR